MRNIPAIRLLAILSALLTLSVPVAYAKPEISIDYEYYEFHLEHAKSLKEIKKIIARHTPLNGFNQPKNWSVTARTGVKLRWRYGLEEIDGYCQVVRVRVNINLLYTMPKALTLPKDNKVKREYLAYYKMVTLHEKNHADIAIASAERIDQTLSQMRKPGSCENYEKEVSAEANRIRTIYDKINRDFDRRTRHGILQGT